MEKIDKNLTCKHLVEKWNKQEFSNKLKVLNKFRKCQRSGLANEHAAMGSKIN